MYKRLKIWQHFWLAIKASLEYGHKFDLILHISDIFVRRRPRCTSKLSIFPQNYKYFSPNAQFSGNEITKFHMFYMHAGRNVMVDIWLWLILYDSHSQKLSKVSHYLTNTMILCCSMLSHIIHVWVPWTCGSNHFNCCCTIGHCHLFSNEAMK